MIEGSLVLARVRVDCELIHYGVIHYDWQAVNEALLGDVFGFGEARYGDAVNRVLFLGLILVIESSLVVYGRRLDATSNPRLWTPQNG
jgi:hypothetical protein